MMDDDDEDEVVAIEDSVDGFDSEVLQHDVAWQGNSQEK